MAGVLDCRRAGWPRRILFFALPAILQFCNPAILLAAPQDDSVVAFLRRVETVVQRGEASAWLALLAPAAARGRALDFAATELIPGATHTTVQERDREPLPGESAGEGHRLVVDVFSDLGGHARVATWRLDLTRVGEPGTDHEWAIADEERISSVENIYRLSLSATKQYSAHGLKMSVEDLDLTLAEGSVFVSEVDLGVTALVLMGRGTVSFHPAPETERGQVKIFCGSETLDAGFNAAYIRINPADFDALVSASQIHPVAVDARELRRAQDIFRDESAKSFVIDLGDLSRDAWSLLPPPGDVVAELRTRKYDTLTYAKSSSEPEDITLFDRKHKHNIALYASKDRLAKRGRFYSEDDLMDYDVLDYDLSVSSFPERQWIEGFAVVKLRVRAAAGVGTLTLRLADPLTVRSISSREYGRLFGIRIKDQNSVVVNLPGWMPKGRQITLTINYAGRLEPQTPERETVQVDQGLTEDLPTMTAERSYLYSNRSYWYPQAPVSGYATAKIRLTIPAAFDCVASGQLDPGFPIGVDARDGVPTRKRYVFTTSRPARYLSFLVSRFVRTDTATIVLPHGALMAEVATNPRQTGRGRDLLDRVIDLAGYYESIVGDMPYPSFTVALVESDLPGGHSPAFFAELNQPLPTSSQVWRNDPAAFSGFGDFFIAHEMAHQWWGQAVGWMNYHEQWLSEGFAQYFAAMYAQHERGDDLFASVLKHMRRWAVSQSDQGPVYLGYRLGHVRDQSRVFRALVYNKGAMVLHMLRQLVGDEAFFKGLRRFYAASKFRKAGTEDLRRAMEAESGLKLDRFFERWVYGSTLPKLRVAYMVDAGSLLVHVEQGPDIFDVPLVFTVQYADRKPADLVVPVLDRVVDRRIALEGPVRSIDVNRDVMLADVNVGRWPPRATAPASRTAPAR